MKIRIETSARLHLGLLDTNGDLGRLYGSIGLAIQQPRLVLTAERADELIVEGLEQERVSQFARRFLDRYGLTQGARLCLQESIPSHVGLGSGTQLALSVAAALAHLAGLELSCEELALAMGRGLHSGIGICTFQRGGFVMDGGHRIVAESPGGGWPPPLVTGQVPPLLFWHPVPEDWYFVVAIPAAGPGLNGEGEARAFHDLPRAPAQLAESISRLLLMKMFPALVEQDIASFGGALSEIQRRVGDCFAAVQGGRFANPLSEKLIGLLIEQGAAGAGQSSWGPAVYGLVEGKEPALRLAAALRESLAGLGGGQALCVQASNQGARMRELIVG